MSRYTRHLTGSDDEPGGVAYTRELAGLLEYTLSSSGNLNAYVHGKQYLSQPQTADGEQASSIDSILRTPTVYVDRKDFYIAYQPKDEFGSTNVRSGYSVHIDNSSFSAFTCGFVSQETLRLCTGTNKLSASTFAGGTGGAALEHSITLQLLQGSAVVKTYSSALVLSSVYQPAWYSATLRSTATGSAPALAATPHPRTF